MRVHIISLLFPLWMLQVSANNSACFQLNNDIYQCIFTNFTVSLQMNNVKEFIQKSYVGTETPKSLRRVSRLLNETVYEIHLLSDIGKIMMLSWNDSPSAYTIKISNCKIPLGMDAEFNEVFVNMQTLLLSNCSVLFVHNQTQSSPTLQSMHFENNSVVGTMAQFIHWESHFLAAFPALKNLSFFNNGLLQLPLKWFASPANLTSITHLNLSRNHLSTLPSTLEQYLNNLERLDLSHNAYQQLRKPRQHQTRQQSETERVFGNQAAVGGPSMQHSIKPVLNFMMSRQRRDVALLRSEEGLMPLFPRLSYLNLAYNEIGEIDALFLRNFPLMETFLLNGNRLTAEKINAGAFLNEKEMTAALQILSLNGNRQLRRLDKLWTFNLLGLQELWLEDCGIGVITVDNLSHVKQLELLSLSFNALKDFPADLFDKLPQLRELHLSHNQFITFDSGIFRKSLAMETFLLDHNQLRELKIPTYLSRLDVRGNLLLQKLSLLNPVAAPAVEKGELLLDSTLLQCDCDLMQVLQHYFISSDSPLAGLCDSLTECSPSQLEEEKEEEWLAQHNGNRPGVSPPLELVSNANQSKPNYARGLLESSLPLGGGETYDQAKPFFWALGNAGVSLHLECRYQHDYAAASAAAAGVADKRLIVWKVWPSGAAALQEQQMWRESENCSVLADNAPLGRGTGTTVCALTWPVPALAIHNAVPTSLSLHFSCAVLVNKSSGSSHGNTAASARVESPVHTVRVFEAPRFINTLDKSNADTTTQAEEQHQPVPLVVGEHHPVRIPCMAIGYPPPTSVIVKLDSDELPAARSGRLASPDNTGHFVIRSVVREDAGRYQCLAANAAANVSRVFHLQVHYPPTLIEKPASLQVVKEGSQLKLLFKLEGRPEPRIQWRLNGKLIGGIAWQQAQWSVQLLDGGQGLYIDRVSSENAGSYEMIASNLLGVRKYNFTVQVVDESGMLYNAPWANNHNNNNSPGTVHSPMDERAKWFDRHFLYILLLAVVAYVVIIGIVWVLALYFITRFKRQKLRNTKREYYLTAERNEVGGGCAGSGRQCDESGRPMVRPSASDTLTLWNNPSYIGVQWGAISPPTSNELSQLTFIKDYDTPASTPMTTEPVVGLATSVQSIPLLSRHSLQSRHHNSMQTEDDVITQQQHPPPPAHSSSPKHHPHPHPPPPHHHHVLQHQGNGGATNQSALNDDDLSTSS